MPGEARVPGRRAGAGPRAGTVEERALEGALLGEPGLMDQLASPAGTADGNVFEVGQQLIRVEPAGTTNARQAARRATMNRLMAGADALAGAAAAVAAGLLAGFGPEQLLIAVAVLTVGWPVISYLAGLYSNTSVRFTGGAIQEARAIAVLALAATWVFYAFANVLLAAPHPAVFALVGAAVAAIWSVAGRGVSRSLNLNQPHMHERTAIIGSGMVAARIASRLTQNSQHGVVPIGIIDDDPHPDYVDPALPRLGGLDDLEALLRVNKVDRAIIAFTKAGHEELLRSIRICWDAGVPIDVVPRLFEFLDGARTIDQVGGVPLMSIHAPRLSRSAKFLKRTLDIVGSGFLLLAVSPMFIIASIAIKLESRGPVFFKQRRAGRGGEPFNLIKFRSMYRDADKRKDEVAHANDLEDGVMFKIHDDPRVTRVGRILRRTSLDELPQLINVLKGEMSLVGPRPIIFEEANNLEEPWHARRLDLRPGMTGPWQIYGRSDIPFQEMIRFDYQYVAGWSLGRDIEILFATVPAVISGRGAY